MAFINEYISEENIEKYNLKQFIEKYKRYTYSPRIDNINWTVDKENDIWLIFFGREHAPEIDHEFTREYIFVLYYKGHIIEARLWLEEDSSFNIATRPYIINWKLLSLIPHSLNEFDIKLIKNILCDALKFYGKYGVEDKEEEDLLASITVSCKNFKE